MYLIKCVAKLYSKYNYDEIPGYCNTVLWAIPTYKSLPTL